MWLMTNYLPNDLGLVLNRNAPPSGRHALTNISLQVRHCQREPTILKNHLRMYRDCHIRLFNHDCLWQLSVARLPLLLLRLEVLISVVLFMARSTGCVPPRPPLPLPRFAGPFPRPPSPLSTASALAATATTGGSTTIALFSVASASAVGLSSRAAVSSHPCLLSFATATLLISPFRTYIGLESRASAMCHPLTCCTNCAPSSPAPGSAAKATRQ